MDVFKKKDSGTSQDTARTFLQGKLGAFQSLLANNNTVLAAMADLEEKRSGEYLFDRAYLTNSLGQVSRGVGAMVESLQELSDGRYAGLRDAFGAIQAELAEAVRGPRIDVGGPLVLDLKNVSAEAGNLAGGKMAHLGRIATELGLPVPEGFVVTAAAFAQFMAHAGIAQRVRERLAQVPIEALDQFEQASAEIRAMIAAAPLPPPLVEQMRAAVARLVAAGAGQDAGFAVRSSAVWEDGEFSFAGQYETRLNVPADALEQSYREVVGSLFTPRAVFYYRTKGFAEEEMAMAVGVMRMIPATAAGVLLTRDPLDPEREVMVAHGVWGLGTTLVDGLGHADVIVVARGTGQVVERRIAEKSSRDAARARGGVHREPVEPSKSGQPSLDDAHAGALVRYGAALERLFGGPQDVEWALDGEGRLWILQSRPLQVLGGPAPAAPPRRIAGRRVLIDAGVVACKGVGAGPVVVVRTDEQARAFPPGAVLVAHATTTGLAMALPRAAALVTDVGSAAGHLASLAREYGIPALLDTGIATAVLAEGSEVTVDAYNGNVYEGRVEELLSHAAARRRAPAGTPLLQSLERVLALVTPLNLDDPAAAGFRPEGCRTLHDITRFCHEQAMAAMFDLAEARADGGDEAIALRAGIPVAIYLLDLDGGLGPHRDRVEPETVLCVPFAAFLRGMRAMTWPEPRAADAKGLLGMMAHTATIPEEQLRATAEKSLALIAANYMNFSIRLGYHYSQVEAWVGEQLNDNYIRFFFKGGGAVRDRRLRRVRLIAQLLERLDFRVQVADDVVRALLVKDRRPALERTLEALGRLTAYTKQLDMAMFNDAVADWYRDEFVRDHLPGAAVTPRAPQ